MTRATALLSALLLAACKTASTPPVDFPPIAPLPQSVAEPCPPAELLSASNLGSLVSADIALAVAYAQCKARHASAVAAYNTVRAEMAARSAKQEKANEE